MTSLDALYIVVAVVVAVVGGVVALAIWQGVMLLGAFKTDVLPRVEELLTQVHQTMDEVNEITDDLRGKLGKLDATLDEAQLTVHSVVEASNFVNEGFVRPARINLEAFKAGTKAAWDRFQELRRDGHHLAERPSATELLGPPVDAIERLDAIEPPR